MVLEREPARMVDFKKILNDWILYLFGKRTQGQEGFISDILNSMFNPVKNVFIDIGKSITDVLDGIAGTIEDVNQIVCAFNTFPNRFRNLTAGFNNIFVGVGEEFIGLGFALNIGFSSLKELTEYIAEFVSTYVGCGYKFASNIIDCVMYYIFDIFRFVLYLPVRILLWILYMAASIDLYPAEMQFWDGLESLDQFFFPIAGFHLIHYPKSVRDQCYVCKRLKTSAVAEQAVETDRVFREDIPCQFKKGATTIKRGMRYFDEMFRYPLSKHPDDVQ
jgi:hypothetical protein